MTRWWDPGSDVALLEPFGAADVDLANALVAVHRAGAAAIADALATYPVIDDELLAAALGDARACFAPLLIEPVAKATSSSSSYAGLLLRDIYDDAETAAIQLFRVGVSKGLPRRVAADRVAKVFGVGSTHLGRYAAAATDPRTPGPMISDLADETLFAAVAAVVANETEGIAKAETPERRRDASADQPRDHGHWANRSIVDQLLAQVNAANEADAAAADKVETETPPPPPRRARRAVRAKRAVRTTRDAAGAVTTAPMTTARMQAGSVPRRRVTARSIAMSTIARRINNNKFELDSPAGRERPLPDDYLAMKPGPPLTQRIEDVIAFALPKDEANAFLRDAPTAGGHSKVFRASAITEYAGSPRRYADLSDDHESAHNRLVKNIASNIAAGSNFKHAAAPHVYKLSEDELDELQRLQKAVDNDDDIDAEQDLYNLVGDLQMKAIANWEEANGVKVAAPLKELAWVDLFRDYNDDSKWVMVYLPPPASGGVRPVPTEVEFVLAGRGDAVRGEHEIGERYGEEKYTLDPNLPLRYIKDPEGELEQWDEKSGALISTKILQVADEQDMDDAVEARFRKAESPEQRRVASADQPREHGHWATKGIVDQVVAQINEANEADTEVRAPRRAQRARRATRAIRRGNTAMAGVQPIGAGKVSAGTVSAAKVSAAKVSPAEITANRIRTTQAVQYLGEINPFEDYVLVGDVAMASRLGAKTNNDHTTITGKQVKWLASDRRSQGDGHKVHASLLDAANTELLDHVTVHGAKLLDTVHIETDSDWLTLADRISTALLDDGHDGVYLTFTRHAKAGQPVTDIALSVPQGRLPAQHVLRWASGTAESSSLDLVPEAQVSAVSHEYLRLRVEAMRAWDRTANTRLDRPYPSNEWIANPRVQSWRIQDGDDPPG